MDIYQSLEKKMVQLSYGEIDFSEAGDWLYNNGDLILFEMNWLREQLEK
jgi:hypothetical protein